LSQMYLLSRLDVRDRCSIINGMIITIARQCGCKAACLGRILAKDLGLKLYTRQDLMEKAREKGMLDEMRSFFEECPLDDLTSAIPDYGFLDEDIRPRFCRFFNDIIGDESCIIIGRCGNYVFRHREDLVSIFLHGNRSQRIRNVAEEEHLGEAAAADFVDEVDEHRMSYHRYYTGLTWGNATDYDLSVDCLRMGTEKTAMLIERYIGMLQPRS
jgi:CMP/dCMP kinase